MVDLLLPWTAQKHAPTPASQRTPTKALGRKGISTHTCFSHSFTPYGLQMREPSFRDFIYTDSSSPFNSPRIMGSANVPLYSCTVGSNSVISGIFSGLILSYRNISCSQDKLNFYLRTGKSLGSTSMMDMIKNINHQVSSAWALNIFCFSHSILHSYKGQESELSSI